MTDGHVRSRRGEPRASGDVAAEAPYTFRPLPPGEAPVPITLEYRPVPNSSEYRSAAPSTPIVAPDEGRIGEGWDMDLGGDLSEGTSRDDDKATAWK